MCRISKKNGFLIVNTEGLQREREVPRYTKCVSDHQKNGECTLMKEYNLLILQEVSTSRQFNTYTNL